MSIKDEAFSLLKEWCDELISLRVTHKRKELDGGILCPACSVIHGRCGDLVLPLMYLYSVTEDERYKMCAEGVFNYSENNLLRPDGSYYNDVGSTWRGISVFSALSYGETLLRFSHLLSADIKKRMENAFLRLVNASILYFTNEVKSPNINYFAGMAAMLAMSYKYTQDEKHLKLSCEYERCVRELFDENGLLAGEGQYKSDASKKGCHSIDMGYNLEESLPLLVIHAHLLGDEEKLAFYTARVIDHLEFILPDGAIDNSFGTRMNKWTYFGSRTSDGMQGGLVYVAEKSPVIAKALLENLRLQKRCTNEGLLFAGLMQRSAGEPPCIHHSFTHAKALALFCLGISEEAFDSLENVKLLREKEGIRKFQNGNLLLVTRGGFTATVNSTDTHAKEENAASGGSLSLLWHKERGAILASTLHTYTPAEPLNMQYQRGSNRTYCMTARFVSADADYSSDADNSVILSSDGWQILAKSQEKPISFKYEFDKNAVHISVTSGIGGEYILPIITESGENITVNESSLFFGNNLLVSADNQPDVRLDNGKRFFNQIGGFQYAVAAFRIKDNETLNIKITVT